MTGVGLVTRRELSAQVRTKSFRIGTVIMVVLAFAAAAVPGLIVRSDSKPDEATKIAVVGELAGQLGDLEGYEVVPADSVEAAEEAVGAESVEAAVVPSEEAPMGFEIVAKERAPSGLISALTLSPTVRLLEPEAINSVIRYFAAVVFSVLFFMLVMMYGQVAAQNAVVEKQTRVIEILLATVPARTLLAGKILSNAILAFATVAAMVVAFGLGLVVGGGWSALVDSMGLPGVADVDPLGLLGGSLAWFLVFFVVAFVMFSALMVGSAATVSRLEEVGSVLSPTMIVVMVPYFLVIFFNDNKTVIEWLSYIPFSSPIAMPLRLIAGTAAWWEPVLALVILLLTTVGAIWLGGKLYENSILRTGARVKFGEALKTAA
ncbi:MAG: ABC transporter permease, partial [Bifidobacteriaceae bacterium]|jgi:ABC-2 type transport system permease protein|nr:ABC transporter permease [Bifidobacteriaceae bacterium]